MFLFAAADTLQGAAGTASAITVSVWGVNVTVATGAETFGLLFQGQLPSSAGILFTVPAGQAYIVKSINITNATASAVAGVQLFQHGAAAANSLIGPLTMAGHYTLTGSENGWAMTDAAGSLQTSGGGGGGGTVTSVGLSMPVEFTVSGSPVTGSGTLAAAKATQSANTFWRGPTSGAAAAPIFGVMVAADLPAGTGGLINVQTFTSGTGTYTPTAGTNSVIIELVGGGAGGGGVASPGGSNASVGGGGAGGAWLRKRLTSNFSASTYVIGGGGAGGASGGHNGANGNATTLTTPVPVTYTANGGANGGFTSGVPFQVVGPSLGGTAVNGDINVSGGNGPPAIGFTGPFFAYGGAGGSSMYSSGGISAYVAANPGTAAGVNATGFGGGGSGSAATGTGAAAAGGNGSGGMIIIYEYS